jgi:hypothetical protein
VTNDLIARLESIDIEDDHDLYDNAPILKEAANALRAYTQTEKDLVGALELVNSRAALATMNPALVLQICSWIATEALSKLKEQP